MKKYIFLAIILAMTFKRLQEYQEAFVKNTTKKLYIFTNINPI